MSKPKKQNKLQETVQEQLASMLDSKDEPSEGRMKLLKLSIAYLAVQSKIEENEYGTFFSDDEPGSASGLPTGEGEEPAGRVRASRKRNGSAGEPSLPGLEPS